MANSGTSIILVMFSIVGILAIFSVGGPSGNQATSLFDNLTVSFRAMGNTLNLAESNSVGVLGANIILASGALFNLLYNLFTVVPTSVINLFNIPVIGSILTFSILFIISISVLSYTLARMSNP